MNATEMLSQIKVASPCRARWQDMAGDDRSRYCHQCRKHVYNFSAMSAGEVADLIHAKEGQLCGRFYRRRDGTMLTANCPVGAEGCLQRLKALVVTAAMLLLTSLGIRGWSNGCPTGERGPFAERCDFALWKVKGWLGLIPKGAVVMGYVVSTPAPAPPPPQATTVDANHPDAAK